ncbi:MAG: gephyrin-like molybdotransferase Glp [Solibacillus sp.]
MIAKRTAILIGEAIEKVMRDSKRQPVEEVSLLQSANRFLAEDIVATNPVPAFDRALYDGYAIRAEDTANEPVTLQVIGEIGAGSVFTGDVQPNQAVRIMTGAEMPAGCNAVVMLEDVIERDAQKIEVRQLVQCGARVFLKGAEIRQGACVLAKGTQITPGVIGILATFGYHHVPVFVKPIVGVLATGSELLDVDEPLAPGKIRNSNSYMLLAQVEQAGGEAVYLGKLEDDLEKSVEVMRHALTKVDVLLTTGGVSVGDYDYLPAIYTRLGAEVLFNKLAMRPGSVTTVAVLGEQYLFGLSGNPSASFIGFELFVRPLIRQQLGSDIPHLLSVPAVLADDYSAPNQFTQLIRVKSTFCNGQLIVSVNGLNMSGAITAIAGAEALAVLPPTTTGYKRGQTVNVLLLAAQKGQAHSYWGDENES